MTSRSIVLDFEPAKQYNGTPDDGIVSCVAALGCLRSPPISSIIADVKNNKNAQNGTQKCAPKSVATAAQISSVIFNDLIQMPGPLTEDAVLKCLQARFLDKQYHVICSFHNLFDSFEYILL